MRLLAHAASAIVVLCSVITVHAAPTDSVTVAFTNQTVMDMDALSSPTCTRNEKFFPIWRWQWQIDIPNIPESDDINKVCNHLWRELETWTICGLAKPFSCEEGYNRTLKWHFGTTIFCNAGMIQAAFWAGTNKNKYGGLLPCVDV